MKKISILFLIVLMAILFTLVSCSSSSSSSGYKNDSSTCSHTNLTGATIVKDATCTESGLIGGTCSECGSYATQRFAAYGHNMVDGTCTVCEEAE